MGWFARKSLDDETQGKINSLYRWYTEGLDDAKASTSAVPSFPPEKVLSEFREVLTTIRDLQGNVLQTENLVSDSDDSQKKNFVLQNEEAIKNSLLELNAKLDNLLGETEDKKVLISAEAPDSLDTLASYFATKITRCETKIVEIRDYFNPKLNEIRPKLANREQEEYKQKIKKLQEAESFINSVVRDVQICIKKFNNPELFSCSVFLKAQKDLRQAKQKLEEHAPVFLGLFAGKKYKECKEEVERLENEAAIAWAQMEHGYGPWAKEILELEKELLQFKNTIKNKKPFFRGYFGITKQSVYDAAVVRKEEITCEIKKLKAAAEADRAQIGAWPGEIKQLEAELAQKQKELAEKKPFFSSSWKWLFGDSKQRAYDEFNQQQVQPLITKIAEKKASRQQKSGEASSIKYLLHGLSADTLKAIITELKAVPVVPVDELESPKEVVSEEKAVSVVSDNEPESPNETVSEADAALAAELQAQVTAYTAKLSANPLDFTPYKRNEDTLNLSAQISVLFQADAAQAAQTVWQWLTSLHQQIEFTNERNKQARSTGAIDQAKPHFQWVKEFWICGLLTYLQAVNNPSVSEEERDNLKKTALAIFEGQQDSLDKAIEHVSYMKMNNVVKTQQQSYDEDGFKKLLKGNLVLTLLAVNLLGTPEQQQTLTKCLEAINREAKPVSEASGAAPSPAVKHKTVIDTAIADVMRFLYPDNTAWGKIETVSVVKNPQAAPTPRAVPEQKSLQGGIGRVFNKVKSLASTLFADPTPPSPKPRNTFNPS